MSSSPQIQEFSGAGGITLVGDEWNRGAAAAEQPTILMLHGGGQNRFSWKNTGQILANEGYHVVAMDSRGHGDSDRAPGADYAVETLAADVLQVLDAIGRHVVMIGASMGGLTGILVADAAGPERVTGLVLVDVVPRYEKTGSARIRDFMLDQPARFRLAGGGGRCRRRIPAVPRKAAQPRRTEKESAVARRPLVLALGSGFHDEHPVTTPSCAPKSSNRQRSTWRSRSC